MASTTPQANSVQAKKPDPKVVTAKSVAGAAAAKAAEAQQAEQPWVPPEETEWDKYAGNGEPWASGLASMVLHGIVIVVVVTGVLALFNRPSEPVEELEPVEIGNGYDGGGGGHVDGVSNNRGDIAMKREDDVKSLEKPDPMQPMILPMDDPTVKQNVGPKIDDEEDLIAKQKQKPLPKNLGPALQNAMEGLTGKGKGGPGSGGGEGSGRGTGRGSGEGPGTGKGTKRGQRVLRWELRFNFSSAGQYIQQLDALGCYLGIPDSKGTIMIVRNLRERPAKPQYEDFAALKRVYFIDQSDLTEVANELKLDLIPSALVAAMPVSMEQQLVDVETKFRGRKEEDIARTVFKVSFSGGKATFIVVEQSPKPGRK